uniref:EGF-like domain-containing protein n=1 Tax=Rhabditophanes sp. KR3021 TaxID=114890 RepID=A0AC35U5V5_9BILA
MNSSLLTLACVISLLFQFTFINCAKSKIKSFSCTKDTVSPLTYLLLTSPEKACNCDKNWNQEFCSNVVHYKEIYSKNSPTVCICRKNTNFQKGCLQFMMRCVGKAKNGLFFRNKECGCCFNQPDEFCNQFMCKNMTPHFDDNEMVNCDCFDSWEYPYHVCMANKTTDKIWYEPSHIRDFYDFLFGRNRIYVLASFILVLAIGIILCFNYNQQKPQNTSRTRIIDPNSNFLMQPRSDV